jgi:hypothetical protein
MEHAQEAALIAAEIEYPQACKAAFGEQLDHPPPEDGVAVVHAIVPGLAGRPGF